MKRVLVRSGLDDLLRAGLSDRQAYYLVALMRLVRRGLMTDWPGRGWGGEPR